MLNASLFVNGLARQIFALEVTLHHVRAGVRISPSPRRVPFSSRRTRTPGSGRPTEPARLCAGRVYGDHRACFGQPIALINRNAQPVKNSSTSASSGAPPEMKALKLPRAVVNLLKEEPS